MKTRYLFICSAAFLLIAALILQLPIWRKEQPKLTVSGEGSLAKRLPNVLSGGSVRDEPIAASEEMKKAVGELLNFNDGLFRIYELPGVRVSVYVAWWEAGRMSPRLVATHTPDVCWPGNGWVRDRTAEGGGLTTEGGRQTTDGSGQTAAGGLAALRGELMAKGFAQGECRVFLMRQTPEYVVFWHKVGDEMLSYGTGYAPPWWAWLDEMWRGGLNLRKEQLFVRVSSDRPLEEIWSKREIEPLRKALLELGLNAKGKEQGAK
jgi:hypothetical protein